MENKVEISRNYKQPAKNIFSPEYLVSI